MAKPSKVFLTNDNSQKRYPLALSPGGAGNITADASFVFTAPFDGKFVDAPVLSVGTNGVDGANPLFMELEITKNGTSIWTTKPKIDKAAGTGQKSTKAAGTGITVGVLKTDGSVSFLKGDTIKVTHDITRTASPGTEIADVSSVLWFDATADKDTDPTVAV